MKNIFIIISILSCSLLAHGQTPSTDPRPETTNEAAGGAITENHVDPMAAGIEKLGHDAFLKIPGLKDDQKQKLQEVLGRTMKEAGRIKMEIASQKVDFFSALTEGDAGNSKIEKIKKNIIRLDTKRLNVMFKALDEVQKIIGKNPEAGKYLRDLMREHLPLAPTKI